MSEVQADVELMVPVFVDNDIEVDDHGICRIVSLIYVGDEQDDCVEARVELSAVIDEIIEFYKDSESYNQMYLVAHELTRAAERLRSVAGLIEDSEVAVSDLFDIDDA